MQIRLLEMAPNTTLLVQNRCCVEDPSPTSSAPMVILEKACFAQFVLKFLCPTKEPVRAKYSPLSSEINAVYNASLRNATLAACWAPKSIMFDHPSLIQGCSSAGELNRHAVQKKWENSPAVVLKT